MKPALRVCVAVVFVLTSGWVKGQSRLEQKPILAEQAFKNIQLLRGVPVDEFMQTMGFFAASTGLNCTDCHGEESSGDWAKYADDPPLKQTARKMVLLVRMINQTGFGGKRQVTCWSCHRGTTSPQVIPRLSVQYNGVQEEPDEILEQAYGAPSPDEILDKYVQAVGGVERAAALTSLTGKGTYEGYDTGHEQVSIDIFAKSPDRRTTIIHTGDGDSTTAFDGRAAWIAAPELMRPIPLLALTGGELDGTKVEAELSFPARIKQILIEWRVGDTVMIDDREVEVLQGKLARGGLPVKLYFDKQTNLLVRLVRFTDSPVGVVPTQIDYSDYRVVSGLKLPFRWVTTWTDGQSTTELTEVRVNAPIDEARFAKPSPPTKILKR
jgi:photosynthetic reaction center cytochrome c subunit